MVIYLDKKLNLFIPTEYFETFKESFSINVDSAEIRVVDTDLVRERILNKRPDLSDKIDNFMPSMEVLCERGQEMCELIVQGKDLEGNSINKNISLNRLMSMDKNNTFSNVYRTKKVGTKETFELNISNIMFDLKSKTVIFS